MLRQHCISYDDTALITAMCQLWWDNTVQHVPIPTATAITQEWQLSTPALWVHVRYDRPTTFNESLQDLMSGVRTLHGSASFTNRLIVQTIKITIFSIPKPASFTNQLILQTIFITNSCRNKLTFYANHLFHKPFLLQTFISQTFIFTNDRPPNSRDRGS